MAEFLSPAWIEELDTAARASDALGAFGGQLVVEQRVTDAPGGEIRYHVVLAADGARVHAGGAELPDLVITADYETACAIHDGRENAQRALAAGRMDVRGDLGHVREHSDALAALDDLFAQVRARTRHGNPGASPQRR